MLSGIRWRLSTSAVCGDYGFRGQSDGDARAGGNVEEEEHYSYPDYVIETEKVAYFYQKDSLITRLMAIKKPCI